jgi:hypothetical protein
MTMLVMGVSLLICVFVWVVPIFQRLHSVRDLFYGVIVCVLLIVGALGMLAEGVELMGWIR